ncbi:hydrolase, alpha/beta fold family [[Synechococcus] sp. NIES-970]|nr:hydrolase, alpha/beta fold family [[Synechococcus] sp. NIES-970]
MAIAEQKITVGNLTWFYRETEKLDNGRLPIVFLHGLPSHSYGWRAVMKRLAAANFYCLAPDWPGSGFSSYPSSREFSYRADAFQGALKDFLKALDIERCHIVTQGFLGHVGIGFALNEPQLCDRLVILNSPVLPGSKLPWPMQQWGLPLAGDMLTQDPLLVDRTLEKGSGFVIADEDLAVYRQPFLTSSAVGRALMATVKRFDFAQVLPELKAKLQAHTAPTLFLWGNQDPWLDGELLKTWIQAETSHQWFDLPEARHYPQEHFPEAIAPQLSEFLA